MKDETSHSAPLGAERAQERLRELIERQLVDQGCVGPDEMGCTRDDVDIPLEEWCVNCLVSKLLAAPVVAQEPGLLALRKIVEALINRTKVGISSAPARDEVHTIYRTLNVVLAEIDDLLPSSPSSGSAHEKKDDEK